MSRNEDENPSPYDRLRGAANAQSELPADSSAPPVQTPTAPEDAAPPLGSVVGASVSDGQVVTRGADTAPTSDGQTPFSPDGGGAGQAGDGRKPAPGGAASFPPGSFAEGNGWGREEPAAPAGTADSTAKGQVLTGEFVKRKWAPGQSGNPSGSSKAKRDLTAQARTMAPAVLAKLYTLCLGGKGMTAVRAGEVILERAYGKAVQPVQGEKGVPLDEALGKAAAALVDAALTAKRQRERETLVIAEGA